MRQPFRISFVFIFLLAGLLSLVSPHALAQSCGTAVTNNAGDQITVTATLSTSDVNENGEGEPLLLSSSGGGFSAVDAEYFQAHTYTYKATQANEAISGTITGFDGDESCSVSAMVTAQSLKYGFLTQENRDSLESASKTLVIGASALGVVAALCTEGIITAPICTLPSASAAAITVLEAAILDKVATDPSDPNYTAIAQPILLTLPPVAASGTLTQAEADAFNALFANQAAVIAYAQAAITAFNRAQGAFDVGDAYWKGQQLQAAQGFLGQMLGSLAAEPGLRNNLYTLLNADPNFAGFALTTSQALSGESALAYNFPPAIRQALVALGADPATIGNAQGLLFVQDINAVAGNVVAKLADPALTDALNAVVNSLGITVQIAIKPDDDGDAAGTTTPKINLASKGKIPVAILSSSTFDATQVDVSSLSFGATGSELSLAFCDREGEDVNNDGMPDLVCHFQVALAGFKVGDTTATLMGHTKTGVPIRGSAAITVVSKKDD